MDCYTDAAVDLEEARLLAWLLTGLRREAARLSKQYERRRKHELLILNQKIGGTGDNRLEMLDTIAGIDDPLVEVEGRIFLEEILASLTLLQRAVIRETVLDEKTEQQVADELRISQPAVHRIKDRALKRLRECV
jgi:RNA polymerase sigma factor (sigma-70 family)